MSDQPNDPAEKKIIIDEDWKAKVQAEKEQRSQPEPEAAQATSGRADDDPPLPPASLAELITSLGMQTMLALGLMAATDAGPPKPRLNEAKHLIDLLTVLEAKTSGNRTPEENSLLDNLLHELRMNFVMMQGASKS